ncbi:MAG: hypothetical protein WC549_00130 [Actinomycetota bacterium]
MAKYVVLINKSLIGFSKEELDKFGKWLGDDYFVVYKTMPPIYGLFEIKRMDNIDENKNIMTIKDFVCDTCTSINGHDPDEKGNCKICGAVKIGKKR